MAEQYRVTYADMSIPCDTACYVTVLVYAASDDQATAQADSYVDQERLTWINTESQTQYDYECCAIESGGFYGPEGDVHTHELHDAHCCDAGYFPF